MIAGGAVTDKPGIVGPWSIVLGSPFASDLPNEPMTKDQGLMTKDQGLRYVLG
jgi:hypothetical protein